MKRAEGAEGGSRPELGSNTALFVSQQDGLTQYRRGNSWPHCRARLSEMTSNIWKRPLPPACMSLETPDASLGSHRFLCAGERWTSWAGSPPLSSSGWRWSGRGRPGRWAGSPSSSAGLCTPARSPGKAGRSRGPGAPSYNNRCFQTGGQKHTDVLKRVLLNAPGVLT